MVASELLLLTNFNEWRHGYSHGAEYSTPGRQSLGELLNVIQRAKNVKEMQFLHF